MPEYNYKAVDQNGKQHSASCYALDETSLEGELKEKGYWLIDATKTKKNRKNTKVKVTRPMLIEFCISMSAMLGSGIGIVEAIQSVLEESDNEGFQTVLRDIADNITAGNTLVSALEQYPSVFPEQMCNLINAAEYSGNLVEAFKEISDYLQWTESLVKDVKQVSLYPTIVLIVVGIFILVLFTFVVPKFTELLMSVNVPLPLITQVVIGISDTVQAYWYLFLLMPFCLFKCSQFCIRRFSHLALFADRVKLKLPIFGEVIKMLCLSRFTHNMAILTRSGIPILQSLSLCRNLVGNRVISDAILEAQSAVNQGRTMTEVFKSYAVFPPTLLRMMVIGEETGSLERSLNHISDRYDDEIPRKIKKIMGIMEPMIMVMLIGIVGTVVVAIFMPLMSLMGSVG
ncbi:type II secretion system F family protein [Glaciecola petra]|uniref:Type II secretion system F family protein n=1 Tax=Glaciecola petra TaxID=3075602 RepID=A0ABU2ZTW5_9ALTE|nr:type II secretion system F family protein [Aestuariibacter sp. P117]MDT0595478.1 type II secretion system F family protein [Aestuariibacter sp. P117]